MSTSRRAKAVAGLRALADLIESRPDLPVPQALAAQRTVLRASYDTSGQWIELDLSQRLAEGRRIAGLLGLSLEHRAARCQMGGGVEYVVVVADDEPAEVTP